MNESAILSKSEKFWLQPPSRRRAAQVQFLLGYLSISISIITGIFMVPLYLRFVPERLYGLWLATGGIVAWLGMLDMGVSSVMGQRIASAYGRKDRDAIGLYYFNGLLLQIILVAILMSSAIVMSFVLPQWLKATPAESVILFRCNILASLALGLTLLTYGQKNAADALLRPFLPSLMQTLGGIITIAVMLTLFFYGSGLYSIALGMVAGSTVTLIANLSHGIKLVFDSGSKMRFNRKILAEMLRLSPAILVGKTGDALVTRIEPTLIAWAFRPEQAIAYNVTNRVADMIQQMLDRIVGSVLASFAHHVAQEGQERSAALLSKLISLCLTVGIVTLGTYLAGNSSFVRLWLGSKYLLGQTLTLLIALSTLSLSLNNLCSILLGATGDIARSSVIAGFEAFVRLGMMLLLLKLIGIPGLPLAILLSSTLFTVWLYILLRRRLPQNVQWNKGFWVKVILAIVTFLLAFVIGSIWRAENWWILTVGTGAFFALLSVVWLPTDRTIRELLNHFALRFANKKIRWGVYEQNA